MGPKTGEDLYDLAEWDWRRMSMYNDLEDVVEDVALYRK